MTSTSSPGWHARHHDEALAALSSSADEGLSERVAAERLATHGPNRIEARAGRGPLLRFALQFHQPLIYILIVSGGIAAFLREWADAGFRPVDPAVAADFGKDFPAPEKLWTIADLGGWSEVDPARFDKENGSITKIYKQATG